jgi:hypothetical protein
MFAVARHISRSKRDFALQTLTQWLAFATSAYPKFAHLGANVASLDGTHP